VLKSVELKSRWTPPALNGTAGFFNVIALFVQLVDPSESNGHLRKHRSKNSEKRVSRAFVLSLNRLHCHIDDGNVVGARSSITSFLVNHCIKTRRENKKPSLTASSSALGKSAIETSTSDTGLHFQSIEF